MKVLFIIILIGAIAVLYFDDKSQRDTNAKNQAAADAATQQAQVQSQEIQQLTAQVNQLRDQNVVRVRPAEQSALAPGSIQPSRPPGWMQDRLNGAPTLLDPQGGKP